MVKTSPGARQPRRDGPEAAAVAKPQRTGQAGGSSVEFESRSHFRDLSLR